MKKLASTIAFYIAVVGAGVTGVAVTIIMVIIFTNGEGATAELWVKLTTTILSTATAMIVTFAVGYFEITNKIEKILEENAD